MPVLKVENFLNEPLYEECVNTSFNLLNSGYPNFSTNYMWDVNIRKDSFPVLVHPIRENSNLYGSIKQSVLEKINDLKEIKEKYGEVVVDGQIMFYYWTRFSYIPWHNDALYDCALTIYLNNNWHADFGGYFLYEEHDASEEIRAVRPKRNLGVVQYNQVMHCTTPVNFNGEIRHTLQIFFKKK